METSGGRAMVQLIEGLRTQTEGIIAVAKELPHLHGDVCSHLASALDSMALAMNSLANQPLPGEATISPTILWQAETPEDEQRAGSS